MKNLEAPPGPGQLNAVSDIMRQLMSRVNGPALPSSSEPSAQSEESSRHHMTSNSSDAAASAFAQQQMTYYGGNPLMASYYGTPYSSATMASNPLPPQSQVNTNAPLPPCKSFIWSSSVFEPELAPKAFLSLCIGNE